MKPYYEQDGITIYHGDAREVLPTLSNIDLVITDPPYSSGGAFRSDRNLATSEKYQLTGTQTMHANFPGDNRDQRTFTMWCSYWCADLLKITRTGAALLCFIDWRNLPCVIDAVQVGGWVYRGIIPWDKTEQVRPDKGWFRSQCEYIVAATNGPLERGVATPYQTTTGFLRYPVRIAEKQHSTQKPVELITAILKTRGDWQTMLDPFMGSGTALVAAKQMGRHAIGIDMEEHNCEIAAKRLSQSVLKLSDAAPAPQAQQGLLGAE